MKVLLTGATGMVGEGVLLECLGNAAVTEVCLISRKPSGRHHAKLREIIVPDFTRMADFSAQLQPFDACFFCAGVSSVGMDERSYTAITHDTTLIVAQVLRQLNPGMVFIYVSGKSTDSTGQGKVMWARVKGRTENELVALGFRAAYNFRPGLMLPTPGQTQLKTVYKVMIPLLKPFMGRPALTLGQVGKAMIHAVQRGYPTHTIEIDDIRQLALPDA